METIEEVWAGDLFDRRREAEDLIGYLESVAGRPQQREDGHAHVMAVDTAYGHGKTFFLKRLDRHLKSTDHVSAYVDAWADDLEDEPMVALAATLDTALEPWAKKSEAVYDGLANFKSKAGRVAKIVGMGLAKRGAGFLITQVAAEALGAELANASDTARDITKDTLKDGGKAIVDDAAKAVGPIVTSDMEIRIKRFREGQYAISEMKRSLTIVVKALSGAGMNLPITIIVDELDRCRPTYAIKLLEEIKHLFDVSGVVFILGLHGGQLEHSVTAAYGNGFNGAAYLRRFFSRRYSLKPVSLEPLIQNLITVLSINESLLLHPSLVSASDNRPVGLNSAKLIADYLTVYDLSARDAFNVMDSLHTAIALTGQKTVQLVYLLPLIISQYLGDEGVKDPHLNPNWLIWFADDRFGNNSQTYPMSSFVKMLHESAQMTDAELSGRNNSGNVSAQFVLETGFKNSSSDYHLLQNYPNLVQAVGRFN